MSDQTIRIEISANVSQHYVWELEKKLQQVEGVTTDLLEPKDLASITLLLLHFAASIMGPVAVIGGGIKSIHEVAKILYEFLHRSGSEKADAENKKKVILIKNGKRIELYNLSIEEIERILNGK